MRYCFSALICWLIVWSAYANTWNLFLPADKSPMIKEKLVGLPWKKIMNSNELAVEFISGESLSNMGDSVHNKIHFFKSQNWDIWIMQQSTYKIPLPSPMQRTQLAVVVEKLFNGRKKAYYLELKAKNVNDQWVVQPKTYSASCYHCHASGPRKIRPNLKKLRLSQFQWKKIKQWNQVIEDYGAVETHFPSWNPYLPGRPLTQTLPKAKDSLKLKICSECHNGQMRQRLYRVHKQTILDLINHGPYSNSKWVKVKGSEEIAFMPPDLKGLNMKTKSCLEQWLNNKETSSSCNKNGDSIELSKVQFLLSSKKSQFRAIVSTNLGLQFEFHQKLNSGQAICEKDHCQLIMALNLSGGETGHPLRNKHFANWLSQMKSKVIEVSGNLPQKKLDQKSFQWPFQLETLGIKHKWQVKGSCLRKELYVSCKLIPQKLDLSALGIQWPGFLGAKVVSEFQVSGQLVFERI